MSLRTLHSPMTVSFGLGVLAGVLLIGTAAAALRGSAVFSDVPSGAFYDNAVGEMYGAGIIRGYEDGKYHPNDYVTRGQVAVLFNRLRNEIKGLPLDGPADTPSSEAPAPAPSPAASSSSRSHRSSASSSSASSAPAVTSAGAFHFTAGAFSIPDIAPNLSISIVRSGGSKGEVAVGYTLSGGTAIAGTDYTPTRGVMTFKDGETSKAISARLIRNTSATGNRTINLILSSPTKGAVLVDPSSAVITLTHGGAGGSDSGNSSSSSSSTSSSGGSSSSNSFTLSAAGYGMWENGGPVTITVVRNGSTGNAATVEFAETDGSAADGTNYRRNNGTLSFAAGDTTKTFTIAAVNNATPDGNATLTIQLRNPSSGMGLGRPSTAALTIIDDESAPTGSGTIKLEASRTVATNGEPYAYVAVMRAGSADGTATATYETIDDTARNGADYTRVSGTVTFAPGEMKKLVAIPLLTHVGNEGQKYFNFRITDVSGNAVKGSLTDGIVEIDG